MVSYSSLTIAGSTINDFTRYNVSKSSSENHIASTFEGELFNEYGRNKNKFNVGDEIIVKADQTNPPTTKIFTGIIEDIEYHGDDATVGTINVGGRDYSARMVDSTVQPEVYNNLQAGSIVKDIINKYTNDLTTTNVSIVGSAISRITFNQIPVYDAVKQLADMTNMNFYVDTDKDLHFQSLAGSNSGSLFNSGNVITSDFRTRRDTVYNQIWVYGDRYLDGFKETFTYSGLATQGSQVTLLYKPHNTEVTVSGGTLQPGEIKGIATTVGSNVKYQVSYDDKQIIFTSGTSQGNNIPTSGNQIVINYKRSLPIVKVGDDESSKATYRTRIKVIVDKNIKDPSTAEAIMKNELATSADPTKEGNIKLKGAINITPGEYCIVDLPNERVNNQSYNIIEARYDFTKENLLSDQVVTIKVNKYLDDLTDTIKEIMLSLKRIQAQEMTNTDLLTRYQFTVGSMGVRHSGAIVYTQSLGSSFIISSPTLGKLGINSPQSYLGDSRGALTIQWSGGYF